MKTLKFNMARTRSVNLTTSDLEVIGLMLLRKTDEEIEEKLGIDSAHTQIRNILLELTSPQIKEACIQQLARL